jgi:hypothetical protein
MADYRDYAAEAAAARAEQWTKDDAVRARFEYRAPTDHQKHQLNTAHQHIMGLVDFLLTLPESRDRSLALTSLEDTRMRINKAIVIGAN